MTQEERERIRDLINHEISILEKSINTLSELINSEVQSDANDWFTSKESNPSKEIKGDSFNYTMSFLRLNILLKL